MALKNNKLEKFTEALLGWHRRENVRSLPWKGETDPYRIWLSEVILQQTRVEQGLKYYLAFIANFPDVHSLANAPTDVVYKCWEGLGYYSRCSNLIKTARYISKERNGIFPDTYEEILKLNGVGPYTAAAISSFAFNLPYAVVDGNVLRVLSRVSGSQMPVDTSEGKAFFEQMASRLLNKISPGEYNQAIMDFGATVCKPVSPLCENCFFRVNCEAYQKSMTAELPVKTKKILIRKRWFYYLVLEYDGATAIRKRAGKDIWHNLFEYCLVEASSAKDVDLVMKEAEKEGKLLNKHFEVIFVSPIYRQQLTHQHISASFIKLKLREKPQSDFLWVKNDDICHYAFPKIINHFHEQYHRVLL